MLCVLALGCLLPAPAQAGFPARPIWTFAAYLGRSHFDPSYDVKGGIPIGGRFGFTFLDRFGLEGHFGKTFGESGRVPDREYPIDQYGLDLTADLLPESWINPYLFAGWAQLSLDDLDQQEEIVLHMNGVEAGGGLKVKLARDPVARWDFRLDVRGIRVKNASPLDGAGEMRGHLFVTLGFMMTLSGRERNPDRDGDGVLNEVDRCPKTPTGAWVDSRGCPLDTDGDGVLDGLDLCEGTPGDVRVDASGCALDTDGDGVFDGRDRCPDTPARVLTDALGCPLPARLPMVEADLGDAGFVALGGDAFFSGGAELRAEAGDLVREVGRVLVARSVSAVEITGFAGPAEGTDAPESLGRRRAEAVRAELVRFHPDLAGTRFEIRGRVVSELAEEAPGSDANRRVELRIQSPGAGR